MMLSMKHLVGITALALTSMSANAGLLKTDWKTEGDNQIVVHEETGLEWLRFTHTRSVSINSFLSQTGEGGKYEGFRLARQSEVNTLFDEIYPTRDATATTNQYLQWSTSYTGGDYTPYEFVWQPFTEWFGWTNTYESGWGNRDKTYAAFGLYANTDLNANVSGDYLMAGTYLMRDQTTSYTRHHTYTARIYEDYDHASYTEDFSSVNYSLFLVSDGGFTVGSLNDPMLNINNPDAPINAVPEPSMAALLGLGLVSMGAVRRRKSRK